MKKILITYLFLNISLIISLRFLTNHYYDLIKGILVGMSILLCGIILVKKLSTKTD